MVACSLPARSSAKLPGDLSLNENERSSASNRRSEAELRSFSFSDKIAWHVGRQRAGKLHASIVGGLSVPDIARLPEAAACALEPLGAVSLRIGGPFLGRINTGRIYLPVYP